MKQTIAVFLLVTISLLCVVESARNAGLSSAITDTDINSIKELILASNDWANDIHTAYYVSSALGSATPKQPELNTLAKNILKSKDQQSLESIYHAAGVVENLKADGVTVDKTVVDAIKNAIEEGDSLADFYNAGLAALSLRAGKHTKDIKDDDLAALVGKVAELADEDGTFRGSAAEKEGSLYNAGLALQLVARLAKDIKLPEEDNEHVDSILEKVESIVSLGSEEDGTLEFTGSDSASSLATTSAILRGLNALATATKKALPEVTPTHINQIAQYLVNHKSVGTAADAYHLLSGLRSLEGSSAIPIVVSLERASILGTAKGAEGHLGVRVTDVFGKPVPGAKVYLIKAHPVGKDTHVLISNQELTLSEDKKSYTLNFLAAKPEQGFYALEYRVVPSDSKYTTVESAVRTVKVVGSITITDLEVAVADSKEGLSKANEGSRYKASDPSQKIDDTIRIDQLQFVNVKFRVRNAVGTNKPVVVQQAFVKFTHTKSGHEATFVAVPNENKQYSVLIDMEDAAKSQFKSLSGDYMLEIIAGDAFIQNPIHWVASTNVKLTFLTPTAGSKSALGPLPEIHHEFRKPESRPPAAVSSAFTLAVLAPLLFLFIGFISVGANISAFPFSGPDFIYAVGFIGSIGANLALMGLYWFKLTLVQTLGYLAVLSVPTVFFGQRALSRSARRKLE